MSKPPVPYNHTTAQEVIARLINGETLQSICESDHIPSQFTIYNWMTANASFAEVYTRARIAQADTFADQVIEIADTERDPQKARNRIAARQWLARVVNPKRYGEKLELNINEKPSLKDALHAANERIQRPVHDQQDTQQLQSVDPVSNFLLGYNDKQSHDQADELADLLDMGEKP